MSKEICMLARHWEECQDPTGWFMSEKDEGIRMIRPRANTDVFSREGNPFHPPAWWLDQLPRGPFLDGEAWIGRGQFERTQSILGNRQATDAEWRWVKFMCIEPLNMSQSNSVFQPIQQIVCQSRADLASFYQEIVESGGEGVMLRHPNQPYHTGHSPYLLRVKPEIRGMAIVTGYKTSLAGVDYFTSNRQSVESVSCGRLISLQVRWQQPVPLREIAKADQEHRSPIYPPPVDFNLSNGLTEETRANPPPVGSEVPFLYQCLSKNGTPMFARLAKKKK